MDFSSNVARLQPSATIAVSSKAKRLRAEGRDIIDLSAGEPDFDTPAFIADAAVDGIRGGRTRYTPAAGLPELRKAIAARSSDQAGREIDWHGVVVSAGAKQTLFNACFALFGPGDDVLVASPYWTSYPEMVTLARAEPVPVQGADSRDFRLTADDLERAVTERTRGLIYSSPCNPTGSVYDLEELREIVAWARERGVWVIADEIYRRIHLGGVGEVPEADAAGLLDLPEELLDRFVLVDGASKSFAMTGWRIGFGLTRPELASKMTAIQSHSTSNPATPSQVAALAAYRDPEATEREVARMRDAFRRRRDLVVRRFREDLPGLSFVEPRGAFYLFFRIDSAFDGERTTSTDVCSWLLDETGVALVPGTAFGDDRWARLSYATSDDLLEEAIDRMAGALGG